MFRIENNMDIKSFPIWFEEGVAEYVAYGPEFEYGPMPEKIVSFNEIKDSNGWAKYINKKVDVYPQSFYFIDLLAANKGEGAIREIMLKTKEMGFEEAFKDIAGARVEDYEEKLRRYDKNQWKDYNLKVKSNVKSDAVFSSTIKIALIEKALKENPKASSKSKSELMELKKKIESEGY